MKKEKEKKNLCYGFYENYNHQQRDIPIINKIKNKEGINNAAFYN